MPKGKGYEEWELEGMADTIYQASLLEIKMKKDKTLSWMRIEKRSAEGLFLGDSSAREYELEEEAVLSIDKVRSATSRGVNRGFFQICVVLGNGLPNWSESAPYVRAMRERAGIPVTVRDVAEYNRVRALVQAMLRVPRSKNFAVCLYIGDLPALSFPADLKNRIVTTASLLLKDEAKFEQLATASGQLVLIRDVISNFLTSGMAPGDSRPVIQPPDPRIKELARLWFERGRAVHPNARTGAESRIQKIFSIAKKKGYVDRTRDKIGDRASWDELLDFLVKTGMLMGDLTGNGSGTKHYRLVLREFPNSISGVHSPTS